MTTLIVQGGHAVVPFDDGLKALAHIAQDQEVRAVITSTQPHNISGIELCAAARKLSGDRRALHVILMSSTDDYYLAVQALDNGADDFIHKPPNPDELRARLRLADRVTSMKQQLIEHATTDSLTGLLNRRAFFDVAKSLRIVESEKALSVIMFDIDNFKQVNDTYGHELGDRVLAAVGAQTKMIEGVSGRLGGEEFCLLVHLEVADAVDRSSELQQAIRALHFDHDRAPFRITCSFGVAEWEKDDEIDGVLRRADVAMYEAKRSGRDRIVASDTFVLTSSHDKWRGTTRTRGDRI